MEALILGEGRPYNLGKWPKTGKPDMQIMDWSILIGNTGLYSLVEKSLHHFRFPACWNMNKLFKENLWGVILTPSPLSNLRVNPLNERI